MIDFKGRKYHESDGVIHINPWVMEQGRKLLRNAQSTLTYGENKRPNISISTLKAWSVDKGH